MQTRGNEALCIMISVALLAQGCAGRTDQIMPQASTLTRQEQEEQTDQNNEKPKDEQKSPEGQNEEQQNQEEQTDQNNGERGEKQEQGEDNKETKKEEESKKREPPTQSPKPTASKTITAKEEETSASPSAFYSATGTPLAMATEIFDFSASEPTFKITSETFGETLTSGLHSETLSATESATQIPITSPTISPTPEPSPSTSPTSTTSPQSSTPPTTPKPSVSPTPLRTLKPSISKSAKRKQSPEETSSPSERSKEEEKSGRKRGRVLKILLWIGIPAGLAGAIAKVVDKAADKGSAAAGKIRDTAKAIKDKTAEQLGKMLRALKNFLSGIELSDDDRKHGLPPVGIGGGGVGVGGGSIKLIPCPELKELIKRYPELEQLQISNGKEIKEREDIEDIMVDDTARIRIQDDNNNQIAILGYMLEFLVYDINRIARGDNPFYIYEQAQQIMEDALFTTGNFRQQEETINFLTRFHIYRMEIPFVVDHHELYILNVPEILNNIHEWGGEWRNHRELTEIVHTAEEWYDLGIDVTSKPEEFVRAYEVEGLLSRRDGERWSER